MSYSTIKLYESTKENPWKLIPSKLFKIERIADYLATFSPTTISNYQYVKQGLEIEIKVNLPQSKSQPNSDSGFKYISIQNNGENIAYYFVKRATWRSENCVRFELVMDVINTYTDGVDYVFKENTRIIREHKSRFIKVPLFITLAIDNISSSVGSLAVNDIISLGAEVQGDWVRIIQSGKIIEISAESIKVQVDTYNFSEIKTKIDYSVQYHDLFNIVKDSSNYKELYFDDVSYSDYLIRKIDFVSEGINPLLIRDKSEITITDKSLLNQDWFLLYRNKNEPSESQAASLINPVECFLIPSNEIQTDSGLVENGVLTPSFLNEDKYYLFKLNVGQSCTLSNGVVLNYEASYETRVLFTKSGSTMSVCYLKIDSDFPISLAAFSQYDDIAHATFDGTPISYGVFNTFEELSPAQILALSLPLSFDDTTASVLNNISTLDRTDSRNIKLIKLPYCPFSFNFSVSTLLIDGDDNWELAAVQQSGGGIYHYLRLKDLSTKLENTIEAASANPFDIMNYTPETSPSILDARRNVSAMLESKLFNSEFYAPTYVYDSFSLKIELERCELASYIEESPNNIKFTMTSTINSKFLFTFARYICDKSAENFYNIIPVARNNEMVLYNVPYINYIRNGFNYDIKAKNLSNASNFLGLGFSAASVAASLALPSAPLKALGVITSIIGLAASVKTTIVQTIQNENQIKQRLQQAQNQTASVSGSDDVDLMSEYCGNRLKYFIYKPTENMLNLLNDLFFYAGYNSSRMGIPTHNNRVNFDYLECDATLESAGANIPQEILDEIKNSFKTGITYIHKTSRNISRWDIDQAFENWEVDLI